MAKMGLLDLGVPGHWNPSFGLRRALQAKGPAFQTIYHQDTVRHSGLDGWVAGEKVYPDPQVEENLARIGALEGRGLLRFTISGFTERSQVFLDHAPYLIRRAGIEILLIDRGERAGASIAERIGLPYVDISNALIFNQEPGIPPIFSSWPYSTCLLARLRVSAARIASAVLLHRPMAWPESSPEVPFPYEKLNGKRLLCASMGTIQNRVKEVFHKIAEGLHWSRRAVGYFAGRRQHSRTDRSTSWQYTCRADGSPTRIARARHACHHSCRLQYRSLIFVLRDSDGCDHCRQRPTWSSRTHQVAGAGEFLPLKYVGAAKLRSLIQQVLYRPQYKQSALQVKAEIQKAKGIERALEIIERVGCPRSRAQTDQIPISEWQFWLGGIMSSEHALSRLHFEMVRHLLDSGVCPTDLELADQMRIPRGEVQNLLRLLSDIHGVVLHPHECRPWIVHPFSLTPTINWIEHSEFSWWAPCVWCAFGVATLAGGKVNIHTRFGAESETVVIPVQDGRPIGFNEVFVHFAIPPSRAWNNVHEHCSMVLPFRSRDEIRSWCSRHRLPLGEPVPLHQVADLARRWYGFHADSNWHKWTIDEAQEIFHHAGLTSAFWELALRTGRF